MDFAFEQGSAYRIVAGTLGDPFPDTEHPEAGWVLRRLPRNQVNVGEYLSPNKKPGQPGFLSTEVTGLEP
ncbi:MAG: hypothetical protein AAF975_04670, partial [Spirochaetota bacterium]